MIERADQQRTEEMKRHADYLAGKTAGLTARAITRWIAKSFR